VAAVANSNILAMGDIGLSCHQMGNRIASSKGIASPNIRYHYTAGPVLDLDEVCEKAQSQAEICNCGTTLDAA
jgi:hypothetical protein